MKIKRLIILMLFAGTVFLNITCKKTSHQAPLPKPIEKVIIAATGGTLVTLDSIHLVIPPNALPFDGNVFVGRTGNEPSSVPNTNLQIVGKPITLRITAGSILKPIQLSFPVPSTSLNTDTCGMFLYNGSTYFPVEYNINGKTVTVSIDTVNWEYSNKKAKLILGEIILVWVVSKQIPPSSEMGLKEVTMLSGKMTYNEPKTVNPSSKVLLLIHGITSSPEMWSDFISKFQLNSNIAYTNYWTFGYNSAWSIKKNAETLANLLISHANGSKIDIVGHSMGGLVARSMIEQYGGSNYIRSLITVGTPHQGSPPAAIRYFLGGLVGSDNPFYSLILNYFTQGLRDLNTNSSFIKQMMVLTKPPIPYFTIASTNNDSKWLSGSQIIPGPDDGVVSVESAMGVQGAKSPNVVVNIPVPIAHTAMTSDPQIIEQIINYLWESYLPPTVTTNTPSSITSTSVLLGGNVTSEGGTTVSESGVYYGTSSNPETTGTKLPIGSGTGPFSKSLSGLTPNTLYYIKAYATNSAGTAFGNQVTFTTGQATTKPTVTTNSITNITQTTASGGGNVTSDGGVSVTARGVCWSTTQTPTIGNFKTNDGSGINTFTSNLTNLTANTTYYLMAYATNSAGTAYGNQVSFTTTSTGGTGTVTDIDGNVYNTVTIGTQVWMAENLKTTKYRNGDPIPNVTDNSAWLALTTGAYCWYNNNAATYKASYGGLYNWYSVADNRNIAPTGWHVPSDAEWTTLTTFLGESGAGDKLKETGISHWTSPSSGTNSSGFTALPGGHREFTGVFYNIGSDGIWWSSTESSTTDAWYRGIVYYNSGVYSHFSFYGTPKDYGFSVRCVKD